MTLFDATPHLHRNFVDQLCAEQCVWVEVNGRKKRQWSPKIGGGDNDFLDATKLSLLAGYVAGVEPSFMPRKPVSQEKDQQTKKWFAAI